MSRICPACETGTLQLAVHDRTFTYKGQQIVVPSVEYSICDLCGEEVILREQERRNELKYIDARRQADGLLTSSDLVRFRRKWRLTQAQAAQIFGGGVNAFSRYERGEVVQSQSTDLLIRVLDNCRDARNYVAEHAGVVELASFSETERSQTGSWIANIRRRDSASVSSVRVIHRRSAPESVQHWEETELAFARRA